MLNPLVEEILIEVVFPFLAELVAVGLFISMIAVWSGICSGGL